MSEACEIVDAFQKKGFSIYVWFFDQEPSLGKYSLWGEPAALRLAYLNKIRKKPSVHSIFLSELNPPAVK